MSIANQMGQFMARKFAEEEHQRIGKELALILDSTSEGIYGVNLAGRSLSSTSPPPAYSDATAKRWSVRILTPCFTTLARMALPSRIRMSDGANSKIRIGIFARISNFFGK